jgi:hypothetical protein
VVDATPEARGRRESLRFAVTTAAQVGLLVGLLWTAGYLANVEGIAHPAYAVASAGLAGGCVTLVLDEARRRGFL